MLPPSPFNFREWRPIFGWGDRQSDPFPLCSTLLAEWVGGGTRWPAQGQCSIFRGLWSTLLDLDLPWPSVGLQCPICFNLSDLSMSNASRSLSRWPMNWAALPHLAPLPLVLWILKAKAIRMVLSSLMRPQSLLQDPLGHDLQASPWVQALLRFVTQLKTLGNFWISPPPALVLLGSDRKWVGLPLSLSPEPSMPPPLLPSWYPCNVRHLLWRRPVPKISRWEAGWTSSLKLVPLKFQRKFLHVLPTP